MEVAQRSANWPNSPYCCNVDIGVDKDITLKQNRLGEFFRQGIAETIAEVQSRSAARSLAEVSVALACEDSLVAGDGFNLDSQCLN